MLKKLLMATTMVAGSSFKLAASALRIWFSLSATGAEIRRSSCVAQMTADLVQISANAITTVIFDLD